jgi:mercuric reductase
VRTLNNSIVSKANTMNMTSGLVKMLIDKNENIIGFHGFAPYIAEYVKEVTIAIKFKLKPSDLIDTVHPYPTMSESIKLLAQSFYRDVTKLSCCEE